MLDKASDEERAVIISRIKRHGVSHLRKIPFGKHIIAKIERYQAGVPFGP